MAKNKDKTTIEVSIELRDFLKAQSIGMDDSYDKILKRLLKKIWDVNIIPKPEQPASP